MDDRAPTNASPPSDSRDRGTSLIELLITVVLTGLVVATISAALIFMLRMQRPTEWRITESNDISFVQTWLPQDLSAAIDLDKDPTALSTLPGTNVVTMRRPAGDGSGGGYTTVSYRYVQEGDNWHLVRYQPNGDGTFRRNMIARSLPAPPEGWTPDQPPTHAIEITARNQIVLRPVGENVRLTFQSGNTFTTGGGGMSSEDVLPPGLIGDVADPAAPPSRCGRTITMVLDTSGSVPNQHGGEVQKQAAAGFIDAFTGTPSRISVLGFDRSAYVKTFWPASGGVSAGSQTRSGEYVSMLNPSPELANVRARIMAIDDMDGRWPGGGRPLSQLDPNGDGIHYDQIGSGTNWEDGLYMAFRNPSGALHADLPELVVLITDGAPTRGRNPDGTPTGEIGTNAARDRAVAVASDGRDTGARIIGVIVGAAATQTGPTNNLKAVVGHVAWNGTGPDNVGNAAAADIFAGGFDDLGRVLRSIMVAECGGTVTLQKRIETGGSLDDATGVWTYTTETGVRDLDRSRAAAITFDYAFEPGQTSRTVQITETPKDGFVFDRAECSANGEPLDAHLVGAPADGAPGVAVTVQPDQAVSCLMISRPT